MIFQVSIILFSIHAFLLLKLSAEEFWPTGICLEFLSSSGIGPIFKIEGSSNWIGSFDDDSEEFSADLIKKIIPRRNSGQKRIYLGGVDSRTSRSLMSLASIWWTWPEQALSEIDEVSCKGLSRVISKHEYYWRVILNLDSILFSN